MTYEDTHSTPQVTVDNGKIRIEEKTSGGFWILDFGFAALFENRENVVTVYVPEKAALDTVKLIRQRKSDSRCLVYDTES